MIHRFLTRGLYAALVCAVAGATPVLATCRGTNLYDGTNPEFRSSVERKVAKLPYSNGVYWEVSKGGKTNWVIGTIHLTDHRVSKVPSFFRKKIQKARLFQMEITPAQTATAVRLLLPELLKRAKKKKAPKNWWGRLTPKEQAAMTKEAKAKRFDVRKLKRGTPATMAALIRLPKCATDRKAFLDVNLMKVAQKARVPLQGLDDPKKRVKEMLRRRSSDEDFFAVLRVELARLQYRKHYVETMVQMYKRGQVEEFLTFESAVRKQNHAAKYHRSVESFLRDRILTGRNKEWMPSMVAQMTKGNVVTAVGAAHLPGQNGVLNLLRKRGFTIKQLNF